jgi:hypothetical protein
MTGGRRAGRWLRYALGALLVGACGSGSDDGGAGGAQSTGGAPSGGGQNTGGVPGTELCTDTCRWPGDGECDDGGPDSVTDFCDFGTDCTDCGTRTGGSSGAGGGTSTGGAGGSANATCTLLLDGATGNEPGGQIPVCCAPTAAEKVNIDEVFRLLNEHRAANGLPAYTYDPLLEATIQGHCLHMDEHPFFDHTAPEAAVGDPWPRAELCGTTASGENIARGQDTPADVMASWTSSSGHNANMLSDRFTRVGICYHDGTWGQIFD